MGKGGQISRFDRTRATPQPGLQLFAMKAGESEGKAGSCFLVCVRVCVCVVGLWCAKACGCVGYGDGLTEI